ncbi:MAG: tetratricopeptide repeat protein, partial [Anaerolineae bacterium]|nr:tetratricopeptide repeat protein [Anaerolineae bacterium]
MESSTSSETGSSTTPDPSLVATSGPPATPSPIPLPTDTPVPSERLALAHRAFTAGNYALAQQEFAALLNDPGINPDEQSTTLYWRGRSELAAGQAEAAIDTFNLFLADYPTDPLVRAAQFNLGRAYEQSGQSDQAITTYLGALIPDDPVNVYIYERIGNIALQTRAYDRAIEAYQAGTDSTEDIALETR